MRSNLLFCVFGFLLQVSAQNSGLTVSTQQGPVTGTLVLPTVRRFLGIPFATAKRWQAPELPAKRKGVFQANKFSDVCFQEMSAFNVGYLVLAQQTQGINATSSEDCLTANIWSPSVDRKQKTAVMVWIYGGGFTFGSSNLPLYDGQNFVRDNDDVTIVTFNYRLNIFGQPNAPQLGAGKNVNFGLLDIDAAIQWVHANIENFGGDPDRIVIFGQSAGGVAVDAYAFSHPHDTIVKGSPGAASLAMLPGNHSDWTSVAVAVGCGANGTPQQFSCMQKVPAEKLAETVVSTGTSFSILIDGVTIFDDNPARLANGNFLKVPLLGGTTANEDDVFQLDTELITLGFAPPVLTEMISDINTLVEETCLTGEAAVSRINANVPTWRYQLQAIFPDLTTRPELRAYHSTEIPLVFGTYNASTLGIPATPTEMALSRYMQSAWVAFARDPTEGLLNFGWPLYNPNTTSLAQLGNIANATGVVFTKANLIDFGCNNVAELTAIGNQLTAILFGG
uniref:Carboxylic ester hydrolase n=1 Tax=Psilocybe cubensis TaxID=181762 RepID=A0A8H7Y3H9_PSICU